MKKFFVIFISLFVLFGCCSSSSTRYGATYNGSNSNSKENVRISNENGIKARKVEGGGITYIVGRTIGGFVAYITLSIHFSWYSIVSSILKLASIFIPRFDLFGKTSWLIYNDYSISEITLFLMQSIVFIGIFMCISVIDFRKKEF